MIYMEETNKTIDYYNSNAARYFSDTVNVDMTECCDRFLKYVVPGGRIIDIGAGSGRDIKYFKDKGYIVEGIDASEEMCRMAVEYTGIAVRREKIQDWNPQRRYDGIWANASLLHLSFQEMQDFLCKSVENLAEDGCLYFSVKTGILTGTNIDGRYFTNYNDEEISYILKPYIDDFFVDKWITEDTLARKQISWFNVLIVKGNGINKIKSQS